RPRRDRFSIGSVVLQVLTTLKSGAGLAMFALLLCLSTSAAQTTTWDAPAFSLAAGELLDAASKITPAEQTDFQLLLNEHRFVFDAQGSATYTSHIIYRLLTPAALRNNSSVEARWRPWNEERPSIRARVITPDKIPHLLDGNTVAESPAETRMPNVFTDSRVLVESLPALVSGAVVEE